MPKSARGPVLMGSAGSKEDVEQPGRSSPRGKSRISLQASPNRSSGTALRSGNSSKLHAGLNEDANDHRLARKLARAQAGRHVAAAGTRRQSHAASLPLPPAKASIATEEVLRTVRPRPLHIKDKVKVFWGSEAQGLQEVDQGHFARWLHKSEEEVALGLQPSLVGSCQSQVVVVGHTFKAPKPVAKLPAAPKPPPKTTVPPAESLSAASIATPSYRPIKAASALVRRVPSGGPQGPVKPTERPYIRYVPPDHEELDGRVEYDLEDEDLAWVVATQKAMSRGDKAGFTEDLVERLIDRFEKELHCAVLQRPDLWQDDESSLQLEAAALYPLTRARQDLPEVAPEALSLVHTYWAGKRAAANRPLLQRLWFEKPWVRRAAKGVTKQGSPRGGDPDSEGEEEGSEGGSEGVPFMGRDTPRGHGGRVRHLQAQDVRNSLFAMRADLEAVRTMADQMRRQEKLRKKGLAGWRDGLQLHLASADPAQGLPAAPSPPSSPISRPTMLQLASRAAKDAAFLSNTVVNVAPQPELPPEAAAAAALELPGGSFGTSGAALGRLRASARGKPALEEAEAAPARKRRKLQESKPAAQHKIHKLAAAEASEESNESAADTDTAESAEDDSLAYESASQEAESEAEDDESQNEAESEDEVSQAESAEDDSASDASTQYEVVLPRKRQKLEEAAGPAAKNSVPTRNPRKGVEQREAGACTVPGFRRVLRVSASKPNGWTEFVGECRHGTAHMDRLVKVAAFLASHGTCRPAWRQLMQRQGEGEAAHQARLRPLFPFKGGKAAARAHRTEAASQPPQQPPPPRPAPREQAAAKPAHRRPASAGVGPSASAHARHRTYVPGSLHEPSPSPEPATRAPAESSRRTVPSAPSESAHRTATRAPAESPSRAVTGPSAESAPARAVQGPSRRAERGPPGSKGVCRKAAGVKDTIPGFVSMVRYVPSNQQGRLEYHAHCRQHGSRRLIQLATIAQHLQLHAHCRPEWADLARKKGESQARHLKRLEPLFAFRGTPRSLAAGPAAAASSHPDSSPGPSSPPSQLPKMGAQNRLQQAQRIIQQSRGRALQHKPGRPQQPQSSRPAASRPESGPVRPQLQEAAEAAGSKRKRQQQQQQQQRKQAAPHRHRRDDSDQREQGGTRADSSAADVARPHATRSQGLPGVQHMFLPAVPLEWAGRAAADAAAPAHKSAPHSRALQPLRSWPPQAGLSKAASAKPALKSGHRLKR